MSAFGGKADIDSDDNEAARLDGAFCDMDVAIYYLKVWQSPETEQLRPRGIEIDMGFLRSV
jgi:hypothetical protein